MFFQVRRPSVKDASKKLWKIKMFFQPPVVHLCSYEGGAGTGQTNVHSVHRVLQSTAVIPVICDQWFSASDYQWLQCDLVIVLVIMLVGTPADPVPTAPVPNRTTVPALRKCQGAPRDVSPRHRTHKNPWKSKKRRQLVDPIRERREGGRTGREGGRTERGKRGRLEYVTPSKNPSSSIPLLNLLIIGEYPHKASCYKRV